MNDLSKCKSEHQIRTEMFANRMGFLIPQKPVRSMSEKVRLLMARLILEETFELIERGLRVEISPDENGDVQLKTLEGGINPIEVIDGVCDVRFVATKIICLLGVPDEPFQSMVDLNNLMKFSDGHYVDQGGKLIKPKDHPKPQIEKLFQALSNEPQVSYQTPRD